MTFSCMETVGRKSTHRVDRITRRVGATCPLAQGTLQDGLSTCHVKRLVRARLPASRVENRTNRESMFSKITSRKTLRPLPNKSSVNRKNINFPEGTPSYLPPQREWFLGLFGLKTGIHFAYFGLESGMVFKGTTRVYEGIYCFNSKLVRMKEKYANSKMDFRNFFCLRSNLSDDGKLSV